MSAATARVRLKQLLHVFGIERYGFRWYLLRRSKATRRFRCHGQMERVLVRGRWEGSRTVRIYLTDGVVALAEVSLSQAEMASFKQFASLWR